jgi:hypothetical protein
VVGQEATVHRGVYRLKDVDWLDDEDREQVGRVAGIELGTKLKVAGEQGGYCEVSGLLDFSVD